MYDIDTEINQFVNFNHSGFEVNLETIQQNMKYPIGLFSLEMFFNNSPNVELLDATSQSCNSSRHMVCRNDKTPVTMA